ncbi:MAG: malate dehydrogenase, partial [Candidatus Dadabacteria bacterium]
EALVMGGHGDQMVPMPRFTTVKGVPVTELLPATTVADVIHRTRHGGAEIVSLLKTGSAYYAPAAAAYTMIRAILFDEKRIFPSAVHLDGPYGIRGLYVGVPALIGRRGVEKVIELDLTTEERSDFDRSASAVRELLERIAA